MPGTSPDVIPARFSGPIGGRIADQDGAPCSE
jgi:hypothetical protein